LAVFADVAAALAVFDAVEVLHVLLELGQHRLAALLPILALEQDHEIVAADVADEIAVAVAMVAEDLAGQLDDVVAAPVAVDVVEWLEMIEIEIADPEARAGRQQAVDMLVDRHIARQLGQRIGVARGVDLHLRDLAHQVVAGAHAEVAALVGDDEAVEQMMGVGLHHAEAQVLQAGVLVGDQRLAVHELPA
jgi:hypothetical protein